jgi:hypothetical protein
MSGQSGRCHDFGWRCNDGYGTSDRGGGKSGNYLKTNARHQETRTPDLYRVKKTVLGFTTT